MSMRGKIAKKWSGLAMAATVVGASFGVNVAPALAQYPGYHQGGCPVLDTDPDLVDLKMGYMRALNEFRTNNALASGFHCAQLNTTAAATGARMAELCVDDYVVRNVAVTRYVGSYKYNPYPQTHMRQVQRVVENAVDRCHFELLRDYPNRVWRMN